MTTDNRQTRSIAGDMETRGLAHATTLVGVLLLLPLFALALLLSAVVSLVTPELAPRTQRR